jgi:hypothetical protein
VKCPPAGPSLTLEACDAAWPRRWRATDYARSPRPSNRVRRSAGAAVHVSAVSANTRLRTDWEAVAW